MAKFSDEQHSAMLTELCTLLREFADRHGLSRGGLVHLLADCIQVFVPSPSGSDD